MTRAWIFSDLHLDNYQEWDDPFEFGEHPIHDLILCAGDMSNGDFDFLPWLLEEFSDAERSRFFYVPGNHDYWNVGFDAGADRLRRIAGESGITVLDNATVEIDGTRIVGSTLWSDLRHDPYLESAVGEFDFVADFGPSDWRARHAESVDFLRSTVSPGDVVMTHFAPSMEGRSMEMKQSPRAMWQSTAVATNLDDLVEALAPSLWVNGHIHASMHYDLGGVPVIANAKGSGAERSFVRDLVYDTESPEPSPLGPAFLR